MDTPVLLSVVKEPIEVALGSQELAMHHAVSLVEGICCKVDSEKLQAAFAELKDENPNRNAITNTFPTGPPKKNGLCDYQAASVWPCFKVERANLLDEIGDLHCFKVRLSF
jgi:hypothetical protein